MFLQKYLTVSAVTKYIKRKFDTDQHLKGIYMQGEISNFNHHSRGHMYFTLKDEYATMSAVMFATNNFRLKFKPKSGMKVLIKGDISVYAPQGQYQIYVQDMQPDGIGALYLAYEELKVKLEKEGLFNKERKKPIPTMPRHIAIITSPTGAAVRDIITTIERRFPAVKRTIFPVSVQGDYAAPSIVQAIEKANELNVFDTIIVGRGGGSIEELWAFNNESVARAIACSRIPIISAVGHETDYTISDFVADLRAPTPTAAAELSVPSMKDLHKHFKGQYERLQQQMTIYMNKLSNRLNDLNNAYAFKYPVQLTRQKEQDLDRLLNELSKNLKRLLDKKHLVKEHLYEKLIRNQPTNILSIKKQELAFKNVELERATKAIINQSTQKFEQQINKLTILNPLQTMKRGYSITYQEDGRIIKSTKEVSPGDAIKVHLSDGRLDCQVWGIEEEIKNE
ncbi:exodeoxyribonuclease VII large subunit [Bacillaceae bacterium W0354]